MSTVIVVLVMAFWAAVIVGVIVRTVRARRVRSRDSGVSIAFSGASTIQDIYLGHAQPIAVEQVAGQQHSELPVAYIDPLETTREAVDKP